MRTIYRYVLGHQDGFFKLREGTTVILRLPIGAKIVTAQMAAEELSVFAIIDTEKDTELRMFRVIGTGQDATILSYEDEYIGSISVLNGTYMYHIFDAGIFDRSEEKTHGHDQSARSDRSFVARLQHSDSDQ